MKGDGFLFREKNEDGFLRILTFNFDLFIQRAEHFLPSICCARDCGFSGEQIKYDRSLHGAYQRLVGKTDIKQTDKKVNM